MSSVICGLEDNGNISEKVSFITRFGIFVSIHALRVLLRQERPIVVDIVLGLQVNRIAGDADFFFGEQVRTLAGDVALAACHGIARPCQP